ncbi:MAG TPA: retroviral-like aspartic protease family protein [Pyrinomonadaceae bacterium]|nr:retroviral-like aspartic protease family protein [Pyrinomonadaceae bacterium]
MKTIRYSLGSTFLMIVCVSGIWGQASNTVSSIEIPFEFIKNEIVVQVKINGKGPFNMMLDTGTDPSAIDLNTAKEIGLKLNAVGRQASGGGTSVNLAYQTKFSILDIGGLEARNIDAAAIDLSAVSEGMGKKIHGVLGQSLLNKRIVQFDYPKSIVRFYARSPFSKSSAQPNTPTHTTVSFRYDDNVLIDDVMVNGKRITANLDTGSSGSFQLTPTAVTALGLESEAGKGEAKTSVGYNGAFESRSGQVKNITIGGISLDAPAVIFFGKGTGHDKPPWGINIGNVFLKDFVLTIDYQSKTITFERH